MKTPESETLDRSPTFTVTGGASGAGMPAWAGAAAAAGAAVAAGAAGAVLLARVAAGAAGGGVELADWQANRATSRLIQPLRAAYRIRPPRLSLDYVPVFQADPE